MSSRSAPTARIRTPYAGSRLASSSAWSRVPEPETSTTMPAGEVTPSTLPSAHPAGSQRSAAQSPDVPRHDDEGADHELESEDEGQPQGRRPDVREPVGAERSAPEPVEQPDDDRDEDGGATLGATASTTVHFAKLSDDEIEDYVATGEPLHVAGAFTIDGLGGAFVTAIEGDHHNVVGVSLPLLRQAYPDRPPFRRLTGAWRPRCSGR